MIEQKTKTLEDMIQEIIFPKFEIMVEQLNQVAIQIKHGCETILIKHKINNGYATPFNKHDFKTYQIEVIIIGEQYRKIIASKTKKEFLENIMTYNKFVGQEIKRIKNAHENFIPEKYNEDQSSIKQLAFSEELSASQIITKSACDSMEKLLKDSRFDIKKVIPYVKE